MIKKTCFLLLVLLLFSGCLEDSESNAVNWFRLANYPDPCVGDNNVLVGIGDELTCKVIDVNSTGGSGTTYTGLNQIVVDSDANTIANAIWIASEAEIDANALAVVNALDLNTSLGYSSYNCDNNSSCTITGSINSTTGEFVNLTVTGTTTTETDLSVFDDFNAGITGSYPLIYKKAGSFSLFGSTVSGTASMGVGVLSIADGPYATAIGFEAVADGTSTIAMNNKSYATGNYAMAFGNYASADGTDTVAIGLNSDANVSGGPGGCVAIGYGAKCTELGMVALSKDVNVERNLIVGGDINGNIDWSYVQNPILTIDTNAQVSCGVGQVLGGFNDGCVDTNSFDTGSSVEVYYPTDQDSDVATYEVLQSFPDGTAESDTVSVSSGTGTVLIDQYMTAPNNPNVTVIPAGTYEFHNYLSISSSAGATYFDVNVYKYDLNGLITPFFGTTTEEVNEATSTLYDTQYILTEDQVIDADARFIVRWYVRNDHATAKNATMYYGGANAYTHVHTSVPRGGDDGFVRSIGTTKNLSMPDFNITANTFIGNVSTTGTVFAGYDSKFYSADSSVEVKEYTIGDVGGIGFESQVGLIKGSPEGPLTSALGIADSIVLIDIEDDNEVELVFIKQDLSDSITLTANFVTDLLTVDQHFAPASDNSYDLGTSSLWWKEGYFKGKNYFRDTSIYITSDADGDLDFYADQRIINNANTINFGTNANIDITLGFLAVTNSGQIKWLEDEDYFEFDDDILLPVGEKLYLRDTSLYVTSDTDGELDLWADSKINLNTTATENLVYSSVAIPVGTDKYPTLTPVSSGDLGNILQLDGALFVNSEKDEDTAVDVGVIVDSSIFNFSDNSHNIASATQTWLFSQFTNTTRSGTVDAYLDGYSELNAPLYYTHTNEATYSGAYDLTVINDGLNGSISSESTFDAAGKTFNVTNFGNTVNVDCAETVTNGTVNVSNTGVIAQITTTDSDVDADTVNKIYSVGTIDSSSTHNASLYDSKGFGWYNVSDNAPLRFGEGNSGTGIENEGDIEIVYTGTNWDFDIRLATSAIRFNQSLFDTDFEIYGDTGLNFKVDAGTGSTNIGDGGTTNYSKFESDGTLEFNGTATVWRNINLGAAQLSRPSSSQPDLENFVDEVGADTGIQTYGFAVGEKIYGSFEMQHDYKEGSDITFHVHWQGITAPSGTDNVQWRLTYTLGADDATLDAVTIIDSADTTFDTQYEFKRTDIVVITGTNITIGQQMLFTLERVAATGDAYVGDALIATAGIHYEVDTVGSRNIITK